MGEELRSTKAIAITGEALITPCTTAGVVRCTLAKDDKPQLISRFRSTESRSLEWEGGFLCLGVKVIESHCAGNGVVAQVPDNNTPRDIGFIDEPVVPVG